MNGPVTDCSLAATAVLHSYMRYICQKYRIRIYPIYRIESSKTPSYKKVLIKK